MTGIQRLLPLFVEAKGYYLLPAVAVALVIARYLVARSGRFALMRPLTMALAATAVFSVPVWFNFFNFHFGGFVNPHEFFHYYLGSKYAAEIGYFDLYNAALVADAETGLMFRPADGRIRDLATYGEISVARVLADAPRVKAAFSAERWREWLKDVSYFKRRLRGQQWNEVLLDQGYNATPVWSMLVGALLSGRIDTDEPSGMTFLALLDVALLAAAAGCVAWAFGIWPSLLMVVFLASSYLMAHVHMKGAFLRTDFVVSLVVAMCLLRKGRHGWAGALVGYSTLARVFPAIFLFGPLVLLATELVPVAKEASKRIGRPAMIAAIVSAASAAAAVVLLVFWWAMGRGLREIVATKLGSPAVLFSIALVPVAIVACAIALTAWGTRTGRLDRRHARFFGGFAATAAALVLLSVVYTGGLGRWEAFARKMALHRTTYNHWNIGVTSVAIAQFGPPSERPAELAGWLGNAYFFNESVKSRAWLIHLVQVAALIAAWVAARRFDDALAFAFGFVATYFLTAPTYYYYIILLLPFLYFAAHPDRLRGTLGLVYLFLFGALGFTFYFRWDQFFTTYFWNSVLALGVTIAMIAASFGSFRPWIAPKAAPSPTSPARPARAARRKRRS
jgi:hypothetical protein